MHLPKVEHDEIVFSRVVIAHEANSIQEKVHDPPWTPTLASLEEQLLPIFPFFPFFPFPFA